MGRNFKVGISCEWRVGVLNLSVFDVLAQFYIFTDGWTSFTSASEAARLELSKFAGIHGELSHKARLYQVARWFFPSRFMYEFSLDDPARNWFSLTALDNF